MYLDCKEVEGWFQINFRLWRKGKWRLFKNNKRFLFYFNIFFFLLLFSLSPSPVIYWLRESFNNFCSGKMRKTNGFSRQVLSIFCPYSRYVLNILCRIQNGLSLFIPVFFFPKFFFPHCNDVVFHCRLISTKASDVYNPINPHENFFFTVEGINKTKITKKEMYNKNLKDGTSVPDSNFILFLMIS